MGKDDVLLAAGTRRTPQHEKSDPRQVRNAAGGYVFRVSAEDRLRRFITLGSASGTFYVKARELTQENAKALIEMAGNPASGLRMVEIITEMSLAGRAAKVNYGIFALAVAASFGDDKTRGAALQAMQPVLRTATHLFLFLRYLKLFRGLGGNGLKRALARWYNDRDIASISFQMAKYRNREGFTHRDVFRLGHVNPGNDGQRQALYRWAVKDEVEDFDALPRKIQGFLAAAEAEDEETWIRLIDEYLLSWEMLPQEALGSAAVWGKLVENGIGQTALIRQLSRLTNLGVAQTHRVQITKQLTDAEQLRRGRIHPFTALVALHTYQRGAGFRGHTTWTPDRAVVDALDEAFYTSFKTTEPTGKRQLIAIDVSGSMSQSQILDSALTPREAAVAMAMSVARIEPDYEVIAFTSGRGTWTSKHAKGSTRRSWGYRGDDGVTPLTISPRQRMDDILRETSALAFGATDCALPFLWAQERKESFDLVSIWSDQESWAGPVHVHQALRDYRSSINPRTRFVACGMTATDYSVAEPDDALSLNVSGMDSAVPSLVADFARGEF